jgi:SHOCT-like protein/putative adhesin
MSKIISAGKTPKIKIDSIEGDLSVVGWDGEDVLIKTDEDELSLKQNGDEILFSCTDDVSLRIPKDSSLFIQRVGGDAALRGVMGDVEIKEIDSDLSIRDVGSVSIGTVESDFSLRGAKGNLYIKNVGGDVSIRDVEGNVTLDSVADDLALRGARGNIKVNVGEDVVVYLEPKAEGAYSITAGDDILLVLKPNANVTLTMNGDEIHVDWPGIENQGDVTERVLILGDGSAQIMLSAGGDIRVTNDANAGNSAEEFGNFAGMNFDWSGFGERMSRQVQQATSRAAKRAEETARRVERHAERQSRRWGGTVNAGPWKWESGPRGMPTPPSPPSEPVAEEERMAILKMLAEKKITAEQAEQLLNALEGGK